MAESPEGATPTEGLDLERLAGTIYDRLKADQTVFWQSQVEQQRQAQMDEQAQRQAVEQQRLAREQAEKDTFGQLVVPYVAPVAQAINMVRDDTKDFVSFYMGHPEAGQRQAEIERDFQFMAQRGAPVTRESLYERLVGRDRLAADRQEAVTRAQQAAMLQGGADQRTTVLSKPIDQMTKDELAQFLATSSF